MKQPKRWTDVCDRFLAGTDGRLNNDLSKDGKYFLHGNQIAQWRGRKLVITTAGWRTPLTQRRLKYLLLNGTKSTLYTKRGVMLLNSRPWNGDWIELDALEGCGMGDVS